MPQQDHGKRAKPGEDHPAQQGCAVGEARDGSDIRRHSRHAHVPFSLADACGSPPRRLFFLTASEWQSGRKVQCLLKPGHAHDPEPIHRKRASRHRANVNAVHGTVEAQALPNRSQQNDRGGIRLAHGISIAMSSSKIPDRPSRLRTPFQTPCSNAPFISRVRVNAHSSALNLSKVRTRDAPVTSNRC